MVAGLVIMHRRVVEQTFGTCNILPDITCIIAGLVIMHRGVVEQAFGICNILPDIKRIVAGLVIPDTSCEKVKLLTIIV